MTGVARRWVLVGVALAVLCGWWVTGIEPFSTPATVVVLAAGAVAMAAGRVGRRPSRCDGPAGAPSRRRGPVGTAAPWGVLVGVLGLWQLAAYVQQPRSDHPTLSSLVNPIVDPRPIRVVAFAAWVMAAGWLARR